jgi:hypothetical protein
MMPDGSFAWALERLMTQHKWVYRNYWPYVDKHIELVSGGDVQHEVFHIVSDTGNHERWIWVPTQEDLQALDWLPYEPAQTM